MEDAIGGRLRLRAYIRGLRPRSFLHQDDTYAVRRCRLRRDSTTCLRGSSGRGTPALGTGLATAFLGPRGTFSEEAALLRAGDATLLHPFPTFAAAVTAAERGETAEAMVAIENSIEGAVAGNLDLLIHETSLRIQAEVVVPI